MTQPAQSALLEDVIVERLKNASGNAISAAGYDGLLRAFGLTGKASISKFRQALGRLNFSSKRIVVRQSERHGLSDMEPRQITVSLRRQ